MGEPRLQQHQSAELGPWPLSPCLPRLQTMLLGVLLGAPWRMAHRLGRRWCAPARRHRHAQQVRRSLPARAMPDWWVREPACLAPSRVEVH